MHAFTAQLIDADGELAGLQEALADAGCLDIDVATHGTLITSLCDRKPDLAVICVHRGDCSTVQRIARHGVPVLAVCDEADIDAAFVAGAMQCMTRPLRRRELAGRIREAMRSRGASGTRERKLSDTIAALQREKQDLERLVCVDALTGIANRRHAMELLAGEWKRCARDQRPLALVMIDLDYFHAYNEHYGHPGGDACLRRAVDAMVRCLRRPSDFLGRYGGEEFMAVLPNTDAVGAKIVAERLRAAVEALALPHAGSQCSPHVTISVGFSAMHILPNDSQELLVTAADSFLLQAKAQGRNRVGGHAPLVRPSRVSAQRWEQYAPVYVDPWFADRIPSYLEAVQREARAQVETLGTSERGGGLTLRRLEDHANRYGLIAISMLLRDLGVAVREADVTLLRGAAEELIQYATHVQVVYRRTADCEPVAQLAQTG